MFSKPKAWLPGGIWRPKNPHSLEHLKYLYNVLCKNQTVTEQNKSLLVETLRSISEILIWGDQNDSSVFDFFLEKNMLAFFLRFMRQKSGRYICVQLLQTLNILFENISNETSVYYLLSNNHINSIIVHKFDFSDEEVMAYYISFLKTLSLKLNKHTIHFFYNEHTNDFALYTEAIKFFNHSESMVRIAVRTITLNVYKVDEKSMLRYIRDKTAAPYFSNLVWFIGNHILELDACVRHDADHNSRDRLADLVAEHLDHLHYLNDILCLGIDALNEVLTDHLLNRLLIPLYVYSLTKRKKYAPRSDERPHVSSVVSLFLLSQVFLIISHAPLVRQLADIIFNGDIDVCMVDASASPQAGHRPRREFVKPPEPLAQTLESNRGEAAPEHRLRRRGGKRNTAGRSGKRANRDQAPVEETVEQSPTPSREPSVEAAEAAEEFTPEVRSPGQNSTDEEKLLICGTTLEQRQSDFSLNNRPYLEAVFNALECSENDYEALFALCLLYAMGHNKGINQELLDSVLMPTEQSKTKDHYNISLVEKLIRIISNSCQNGSKVRLATLEMSILLLKQLVFQEGQCFLQDRHLACLEGAREEATLHLRNFYKSEEIFLDMFEDEYREMQVRPLNVEYLMMDSSILLQPTGTPLTGIDFNKRLPCGEVERARRAIRVFFLLRDLSLTLRGETEGKLPLTKLDECVKHMDVLDLNNSDLIACTIITRDNKKERRFLVIDVLQLILVEPDTRRLGWGVVKFVGFLQDVEVTGDKDDSRSLHVTIHKPSMNIHAKPTPLLSARFVFDDHIRCMAAKQRLTKGRLKARQRKMQMIAQLLELPTHLIDTMYQPSSYAASNLLRGASSDNIAGRSQSGGSRPGRIQSELVQRSVFASVGHVSGFGAVRERELSSHAGRAVRQSPQPSGSVDSSSSRPSLVHSVSSPVMAPSKPGHVTIIHDDDIEQAEEAQPSPPAGAAQYLTQQGQPSEQQPQGRRSRSGSGSSTSSLQDIPLEDLSVKSKTKAKPSHPAVSKISARRSLSDGDSSRSRSSSYSPVRSRSGSPSIHARTARRERSHSDSSQDSEAASSQSRRRSHGSSYSSPKRRGKQPSPGRRASSHSVTSFTTKPGQSQPDELFPKLDSSSEHPSTKSQEGKAKGSETSVARVGSEPGAAGQADVASHGRTRSGSGPKSLTPAAQPALSLVTDTSDAIKSSGMGSPKLMPPVEPEQIHNLTDGGSGGIVQTEATTTSQEGGAQSTLTFVTKSTPVVDTNKVVAQPNLGEQSGQASATDQLTRLARTVSEHYTFPQEAHSMEMTASGVQESVNATDEDKQQAVGWQA